MYTNVYFFIHNNSLYSFIKQILYKCNNISKISIVKINLTYLYHLSLRVIKIYYTLTHSEKKKNENVSRFGFNLETNYKLIEMKIYGRKSTSIFPSLPPYF